MTENENLQTQLTTPELIPVSKFNDFIPFPSTGALRQLIFYNTDNFADKVVKKIGKRIYISVSDFYTWVKETNKKQVA